jgi:2,4-dienoyl-CoA reductase-like NADH-dependent reductase (Old Yellow Enzyme family)
MFSSIRLREVQLKDRIAVSPMCEYSAVEGHPQPWHLVHLGSRAIGGAGLVFTEATAVEERGRISPADTGIYRDEHVNSWKPIAKFIVENDAVPGMQLAHVGRKGSTNVPWRRGKALAAADGAWAITEPAQAETILTSGQADLVFLARELLRDPYWPIRAAKQFGIAIHVPVQYERAW